jgi:hypothetical protein
LAIGITSDDDITTVLGDNSFVVVRGQAVFKDALTALSLKVIDTTDSIYSGDDNASIYTAGGASIGKQLSVNSVKVDGGNSDAGCTMVYDASTSCLMFNFNGETSSTLLSADSRGW